VFPKIGVPQFLDGFFKMEHPKKTMDDLGGYLNPPIFGNIQNLAAFFQGEFPSHKPPLNCHHCQEERLATMLLSSSEPPRFTKAGRCGGGKFIGNKKIGMTKLPVIWDRFGFRWVLVSFSIPNHFLRSF